jgi:hypothetical protein
MRRYRRNFTSGEKDIPQSKRYDDKLYRRNFTSGERKIFRSKRYGETKIFQGKIPHNRKDTPIYRKEQKKPQ